MLEGSRREGQEGERNSGLCGPQCRTLRMGSVPLRPAQESVQPSVLVSLCSRNGLDQKPNTERPTPRCDGAPCQVSGNTLPCITVGIQDDL